jgi:hypothetical protein
MVTALTVLVIYALVLLLPLHQAAGLQRDLGKIGFQTAGAWSICTPPAQDDDGSNTPTAVKCALSGLAKDKFAAIIPQLDIGQVRIGAPVLYAEVWRPHSPPISAYAGQARAPPAMA